MRKKMALLFILWLAAAGLVFSNEQAPPQQGGEKRAEIEGFKAYQQQEEAFRQGFAKKMLEIESQSAVLKVEMLKAKDEAAKGEIWEKLKPLREQKFALLEEKAKHDVEAAKQFVTFAEKRVQMAEAHLAEVQAKKTEMIDVPAPEGADPAAEPPEGDHPPK